MTPLRSDLESWAVDHPVGDGLDPSGASRRGSRRFRSWLLLRTVTAVLAGVAVVAVVAVVAGMVALRSVAGDPLGARVTASLLVTPPSGLAPLSTTVDGSGSRTGRGRTLTTYSVDFGDGTASGPQSEPTSDHTFEGPGTYTVTLTVTDSVGQTGKASQVVTVRRPTPVDPTAKLRVRPSAGPVPLHIEADASSSTTGRGTDIVSYEFDFGDGATTGPQPDSTADHTFGAPGRYGVTVTVTDSTGRTDLARQVVQVAPGPPVKPTARLRVQPASGTAPLEISAYGSTSTPGPGERITAYNFDFGDGTTSGPQQDSSVDHAFPHPGTYQVTLTVTDSAGRTDQAGETVTVAPPPQPGPTARLETKVGESDPDGVDLLVAYAYGAKSEPSPGSSLASYTFDLGDGTKVGPQNDSEARHRYAKPGDYAILLTVTDSAGRSDTASRSVNVG